MSVHLIKCCTAKPDKSMKESNPKTTQNYELQTRKSRNTRTEYIKIYQLWKEKYVHFFAHFTKKIFGYFGYMFTLVKSIYTTNTDFSKRCRYEDEVMV